MRFRFPIVIIDEDFRSENTSGLGIRALAKAMALRYDYLINLFDRSIITSKTAFMPIRSGATYWPRSNAPSSPCPIPRPAARRSKRRSKASSTPTWKKPTWSAPATGGSPCRSRRSTSARRSSATASVRT